MPGDPGQSRWSVRIPGGLRRACGAFKLSLMIQTLEAEIDEHGSVKLARPVHLDRSHRALVMIMPDEAASGAGECALLSEAALAEDWNNAEEDAAWKHLQPVAGYAAVAGNG